MANFCGCEILDNSYRVWLIMYILTMHTLILLNADHIISVKYKLHFLNMLHVLKGISIYIVSVYKYNLKDIWIIDNLQVRLIK